MKTTRIATIDVFRAITMFLMLFVNDIPGVKQIPHWLLHAEMNEDMLGFSDIIFPCFLFVMGMSVPFAIVKRQENRWNLYLDDGSFKVYQNPMVLTKAFPQGFTTQEFVLAVAGS